MDLEVVPLGNEQDPHFMVLFRETEPLIAKGQGRSEGDHKERRVKALEQELQDLREQMRLIAREYESATAELQSANEEVVSSNEELQSINEEMQTAKEELQSTNEELQSTNEELQSTNEELTTSKEEEDIIRSYDLGVNSFVTKPVSFDALVNVMKVLSMYWFEIVELPPLEGE